MAGKISLSQILGITTITLLLLLIYTQIASRILFTPLVYDEGYNLQVSYNLRRQVLNYSSFGRLFDPYIFSGPALLMPAAFFMNDLSALLPRVSMLLFVTLFFYLTNSFLFTNNFQRIIFLIFLQITPLFYFFSSHVLGEFPGFVYFLASLIVLNKRKYFIAGILISLSILTKQVYMFGVFSVILEFILIHIFSKNQRVKLLHNSAWCLAGMLSVFILWYLYILTALNFSTSRFIAILNESSKVTRALFTPNVQLIFKRLMMLRYMFGVNGILIVIIILSTASIVIKKLRNNHAAVALAFFVFIYLLYYLFQTPSNSYLHFFPVVLATLILMPLALYNIVSLRKIKIYLITVLIGILIFLDLSYFLFFKADAYQQMRLIEQNQIVYGEQDFPFLEPDPLLLSQLSTAYFIKVNIPKNEQIGGVGWWKTPEIEYLSGKSIVTNPSLPQIRYIITNDYGSLLGKGQDTRLDDIAKKSVIFSSKWYKVYEAL